MKIGLLCLNALNSYERLKKAKDVLLPSEDQKKVEKGHEFERCVAELFSKQKNFFSIDDWTSDIYDKRSGINVESNKNPDIIITYKPRKETFAVECKYGIIKDTLVYGALVGTVEVVEVTKQLKSRWHVQ